MNLLLSEFLHGFISFFWRHFRSHDVRHVAGFTKALVDLMGILLGVDENESLSHLARRKDLLDKIELFLLVSSHGVLLDVTQLFHNFVGGKLNVVGVVHVNNLTLSLSNHFR